MTENYEKNVQIDTQYEGINFKGVILTLKISNIEKLFMKYKEKAFHIINQVYYLYHTTAIIYHGEIYNKSNSVIWKMNKHKIDRQLKKYYLHIGIYLLFRLYIEKGYSGFI